jgi:hypothetical protein
MTSQRILLQILVERRIEVDCAVLRQLQHDAGEDWFPEPRGGKEGVRSNRHLRGYVGDVKVVLPNRLAAANDSHAETGQHGQIQEMRQIGNERFIGRMNASSSTRFCPCEAFERVR